MRYVEKYHRAGQATDDNMAHAHCMLVTLGYKHTLTIFNTHYFSTTTMVVRTHLCVTLYVHYLTYLLTYSMEQSPS
jgi:1,4-dihydroxy-2-naphthoate octaprenyltransferase